VAQITVGQHGIGLGIASALVGAGFRVALGMLTGFVEGGRTIGGRFRLLGFDDIEDCAQVWRALSSVHCNIAGFGRMVVATVVAWLEDGVVPPAETLTSVDLVVRASSA
jgi:LacI family transcriptional regulator